MPRKNYQYKQAINYFLFKEKFLIDQISRTVMRISHESCHPREGRLNGNKRLA